MCLNRISVSPRFPSRPSLADISGRRQQHEWNTNPINHISHVTTEGEGGGNIYLTQLIQHPFILPFTSSFFPKSFWFLSSYVALRPFIYLFLHPSVPTQLPARPHIHPPPLLTSQSGTKHNNKSDFLVFSISQPSRCK